MSEARAKGDFYEWRHLSVGLTSLCNLRCRMCPVIRGEKATLMRDQAFHIVEFAQRRGFERIVVGGGEPTILKYFWEFMDRLAETDMDVWLLTNAVRLTPDDIGRMAQYPKLVVNVSIDGIGAVHEAIRGQGTFEPTDKNLRGLLDAGGKAAVTTCVQRSNFRDIVAVYERYKDWPLDWHGFSYSEPWWGDLEVVPPGDFDQSIAVLEEVNRRNQSEGGHATLSKELLRNFQLWYWYPQFLMHPGEGCTVPQRQLVINEKGDVRSCWHYTGWLERNLNETSLDDIVDDPAVRESIVTAIGPSGCRGCSTMCYFWDEDFRRKTMRPSAGIRARAAALHAKKSTALRFPRFAKAVGKLRRLLSRR